jgi:hypothetical protein
MDSRQPKWPWLRAYALAAKRAPAVWRSVAVTGRILRFAGGLALLAFSAWTVATGLVTGRMYLGTRSGLRGGAVVSDWSRSPTEFVLTALLLLALAAFGLFLMRRALRPKRRR